MKQWLADLLAADHRRVAGGAGIGALSGALAWSSLLSGGPMAAMLIGCGALGILAGTLLIGSEVKAVRRARLAEAVEDHEETERLLLDVRRATLEGRDPR